jgi:hypothetical protein
MPVLGHVQGFELGQITKAVGFHSARDRIRLKILLSQEKTVIVKLWWYHKSSILYPTVDICPYMLLRWLGLTPPVTV